MSIKIFLPQELFKLKLSTDIYGEIKIAENNTISYYIICAIPKHSDEEYTEQSTKDKNLNIDVEFSKQRLRHLGHIVNADEAMLCQRQDVALSFLYDLKTPNIYLNKLSIKPDAKGKINVFLYKAESVLKLHGLTELSKPEENTPADERDSSCNDLHLLFKFLQSKQDYSLRNKKLRKYTFCRFIYRLFLLPFDLITIVFTFCMNQKPLRFVFQRSALGEHYKEWLLFRNSGKRNYNIHLDIFLGICVTLVLLLYIESPADYIIEAADYIVTKFRSLLQSLKGSPIGIKLNEQLNNFLLDCFGYHVYLWAVFLKYFEPFIRHSCIPLTLLGSLGLSYQLALLGDLVSILGFHAHCFSIYTAILYNVEKKGLQVLGNVVLGKRKNVLKNRVESHNYMNRQLYLATIFFTLLLFLFPTILVYYVVFTSLRLCIFLLNLMLKSLRRNILEFPIEILLRWLCCSFYDTESLELEYIKHTASPLLQPESQIEMHMSVFNLSMHSSSLGRVLSCESGILQELVANEENSLKSIFQRVLKGTF